MVWKTSSVAIASHPALGCAPTSFAQECPSCATGFALWFVPSTVRTESPPLGRKFCLEQLEDRITPSGLPPGITLDDTTGVISGTIDPTAAQSSAYSITIEVDAEGLSTSTSFTWMVSAATPAPTLTSPGNQVNAAGSAVDLQLSGTDSGGY